MALDESENIQSKPQLATLVLYMLNELEMKEEFRPDCTEKYHSWV
jgi:hypothetical protein